MSARDGLSCQEVAELVTDAMEGALAAETRVAFEDHIAGCEACRTFAQQIARTIDVLRTLPRDPAPEPDERVIAAFRRASKPGA